MLPIYSELSTPSLPRMYKVIHRAVLVDMAFYLIIGLAGYMSQLSLTDPIALERTSLPGRGVDYPALLAVIAVSSCMVASFPVNVNPFREAFFKQMLKYEDYSDKENYIFVGITLSVTTFISIVFPKITAVLGLLGGLVAIQTGYFIPLVIQV